MPFAPQLDPQSLARLRKLVAGLHNHVGGAVPVEQLVRLTEDVRLDCGLTVDFEASRSLGHPMVVLRAAPEGASGADLAGLSKRERQIAGLIAEGLSNKEIARRLFLALATVKDHVHRILVKTGMPNRAAIAARHAARITDRPAESA